MWLKCTQLLKLEKAQLTLTSLLAHKTPNSNPTLSSFEIQSIEDKFA